MYMKRAKGGALSMVCPVPTPSLCCRSLYHALDQVSAYGVTPREQVAVVVCLGPPCMTTFMLIVLFNN